ncbi:MAG: hypothetical protein K6E37_07640 [Bacteroidales bacterium]|nr:hypothetical protein [Bacteroidales bacterium]
MKRYSIYTAIAAAAIAAFCSCTPKENVETTQMTITAVRESCVSTKLGIEGPDLVWQDGDRIAMTFGSSRSMFSYSGASGKECAFVGDLLTNLYYPDGETYYGGVYPGDLAEYSAWQIGRYWDGDDGWGVVEYLIVYNEQRAVEGSFDPISFPCVGRSKIAYIQFYNVCGGVGLRFSEGCEKYKSVTFRANGLELISGNVDVRFNDSHPVPFVTDIYNAMSEVTLAAPEGGFKPDTDYYIAMIPCTLSKGFSLLFTDKDDRIAVKRFDTPQIIRRSEFGMLGKLDTGLDWHENNPGEPDISILQKKQWLYTDFNTGAKYIYDFGYTFPGYRHIIDYGETAIDGGGNEVSFYNNPYGELQCDFGGLYEYLVFHSITEKSIVFSRFENTLYSYTSRLQNCKLTAIDPPVDFSYSGMFLGVDGAISEIIPSANEESIREMWRKLAEKHGGNVPVVYLNKKGLAEDYKDVDVKDKVVIVHRGEITFAEKIQNAMDAGAAGILFVNNDDGIVYAHVEGYEYFPSGSLRQEIGPSLVGKDVAHIYNPTIEEARAYFTGRLKK